LKGPIGDRPATAGRKLALGTLTLPEVTPVELIDAAAAAGLEAVTLRIEPAFDGDRPPLAVDAASIDEAGARLAATQIGVLDAEVIRLGPWTTRESLTAVLDRAARLGAEHVLTVNHEEEDHATAVRRFRELCELAAPRNIRPALEFMLWRVTQTLEQAYRIVEEAEHPAGAVLVDALHLDRTGGSPAAVAALVERGPERFPYFQLCDATGEAPRGGVSAIHREAVAGRLLPGEGQLPLGDLVSVLPPRAAISIEVPNESFRGEAPADVARRAASATRDLLVSVD
jgi:sugar phosphate isomerase/epimerase